MKTILTTTLALGFIIMAGSQAQALWPFSSSNTVGCNFNCGSCEVPCAPVKPCRVGCVINCDYGLCRAMPGYVQ